MPQCHGEAAHYGMVSDCNVWFGSTLQCHYSAKEKLPEHRCYNQCSLLPNPSLLFTSLSLAGLSLSGSFLGTSRWITELNWKSLWRAVVFPNRNRSESFVYCFCVCAFPQKVLHVLQKRQQLLLALPFESHQYVRHFLVTFYLKAVYIGLQNTYSKEQLTKYLCSLIYSFFFSTCFIVVGVAVDLDLIPGTQGWRINPE